MTNKDPELLPCQVSDAVAKAIYDECRIISQEGCGGDIGPPFATLDEKERQQMGRLAQAAITAMATASTIPTDGDLVEQFARAMFDEWPLHAVSPALADQSGQEVGSALTYDKLIEMGGNHDGLLRLAKGAAKLHNRLSTMPSAGDATCPACETRIEIIADGRPDDLARCKCTIVSLEWLRLALSIQTISGKAWQPIETAPTDGADVQVYVAKTGEQFVAFYANGDWNYALVGETRIVCEPTLWQPLPDPPALVDQGERG